MPERSLLSVVTGPVAKLIVPVATVRTELGVDSSSDAKIERLLRAAARAFAGTDGLRRTFLRQTYLEQLNGDGGPFLPLSRWPIESVTSVTEGSEDPETIDATEYSIAGENRSALYRSNLWASAPLPCGVPGLADESYRYNITYPAGWIPPGNGPGLVDPWAAATTKAVGSFVKPLAATNGAITLLFEATASSSATGATEPTWPATAGLTVTDGGVTWTARQSFEFPEDLQEAAILTAISWFGGGLDVPVGISSERLGPQEIQYDFVGARGQLPAIPPAARRIVWSYR